MSAVQRIVSFGREDRPGPRDRGARPPAVLEPAAVARADNASGRRMAIRSLGALAATLFAARALAPDVAAQDDSEVESERRRKRGRRGRRGRRGKRGRKGPGGGSGPSGPPGPVQSTRVAGDVESLPAQSGPGPTATSVATCAASSVLLGCGYELSTDNPADVQPLGRAIADVVPDVDARTCTATLFRTDSTNGVWGQNAARIQAYAICRA